MGVVQQGEYSHRAAKADEVETGHAAPEQRASLTEIVMNIRPDSIAANRLRGSSMLSSTEIVSRRASICPPAPASAVCAMVFRNTRAATGCRSAW